MTDYTPRNWIVRELPYDEYKALPTVEGPFVLDRIVGMVSGQAERLEEKGITEVFYYDLEQDVAGIDKVYGAMGVEAASGDFELSDGTQIKGGALVFSLTRMDFEAGTVTVLFETI